MMWWGNGMGGWGMAMMLGSGLLVLAVLFAGGYLLYQATRRDENAPHASAEQTLASRYAAGEIDDDEYRRRLRTIRSA